MEVSGYVMKKIVVYDDLGSRTRQAIEANLPDGFSLVFASPKSGEAALAEVADADYMIVWAGYVPTAAVAAGKKLRLIQKVGEGLDRIDVATARTMGIPVAKTSGSNGASVADFALLLMLATIRWLPKAHSSMMAGEWLKFGLRWAPMKCAASRWALWGSVRSAGRSLAVSRGSSPVSSTTT